jgi:hypothetical protein
LRSISLSSVPNPGSTYFKLLFRYIYDNLDAIPFISSKRGPKHVDNNTAFVLLYFTPDKINTKVENDILSVTNILLYFIQQEGGRSSGFARLFTENPKRVFGKATRMMDDIKFVFDEKNILNPVDLTSDTISVDTAMDPEVFHLNLSGVIHKLSNKKKNFKKK